MIKQIIKTAAILALAGSLTGCFEIVETGNTGMSTFMGQVDKENLPPGTYQTFTRTIYEISGKVNTISFDKFHPKSSEGMVLAEFDVDVMYRINPKKASFLFTKYQGDLHHAKDSQGVLTDAYVVGQDFIVRKTSDAIYNVVAQFHATTMHQQRDAMEKEILKDLQARLDAEFGPETAYIDNVNIKKVITDPSIEESIRVLTSQSYKQQTAVAAQETAKAEATRVLIEESGKAAAQASKLAIEAEGQAKANRIIAESLNPMVLRSQEIAMMKEFAAKGSSTILLPTGQTVSPIINTK